MKEVSAPAVELLWELSTTKHSTNTTTNGECLGELSRDIGPISDLVSMRTLLVPAVVWILSPSKVQKFCQGLEVL